MAYVWVTGSLSCSQWTYTLLTKHLLVGTLNIHWINWHLECNRGTLWLHCVFFFPLTHNFPQKGFFVCLRFFPLGYAGSIATLNKTSLDLDLKKTFSRNANHWTQSILWCIAVECTVMCYFTQQLHCHVTQYCQLLMCMHACMHGLGW